MPRVLISDKLSPAAVEIFRARGIETDVKTGLKPAELREIIGQYDGLAIRSATKVTREVIEAAPRLRVVGRAGIGVDNVDVKTATERGVVVMNTPHGNAITTAEHAIAMMFALARQIPEATASTRAGKWEKNRFMGVELTGKTLGLIGCGNIGSIVADRAQGLHMKVLAYDPYLAESRALELGVEKVELPELLARADLITLHTPLTEATRNILSAEAIAQCKRGVRIVNCARGGLVDEAALAAALQSGQVAGAALDVFETEPATASPLFALDNVVCTPHLGAATTEAQENVALQVAEQMADFLLTGAVTNALNMPSVSAEDAPRLRPYMELCRLLGAFAGQMTVASEGALRSVQIEYEGQAAQLNHRPLTAATLAGVLGPVMAGVNMVNAPVLARERGIAVAETAHDRPGEYQTLVRVSVTTDKQTRTVSGTLFAGSKPRLVEIKGIPVEADFGRHMLYVTNQDKPGFIGRFGATLAGAGINIATFHLGRANQGGDAICLVSVDEPVPESVLAMVRTLPLVMQATPLDF
ncbi:MAG: phosphoglycerate dehydrogenase [Pseudomonadota bacterium]|nr:phosphoglycerate dehydrogenase [Pseudomonadota bacterium]